MTLYFARALYHRAVSSNTEEPPPSAPAGRSITRSAFAFVGRAFSWVTTQAGNHIAFTAQNAAIKAALEKTASYVLNKLTIPYEEGVAQTTLARKATEWITTQPRIPGETKERIILAIRRVRDANTPVRLAEAVEILHLFPVWHMDDGTTTLADLRHLLDPTLAPETSPTGPREPEIIEQEDLFKRSAPQFATMYTICKKWLKIDPDTSVLADDSNADFFTQFRQTIEESPTPSRLKKTIGKWVLLPTIHLITPRICELLATMSNEYCDMLISDRSAQFAILQSVQEALFHYEQQPDPASIRQEIKHLATEIGVERLIPSDFFTQHVYQMHINFIGLCRRGGLFLRIFKWAVTWPVHVLLIAVYIVVRAIELIAIPILRLIGSYLGSRIVASLLPADAPLSLADTILLHQLKFLRTRWDKNNRVEIDQLQDKLQKVLDRFAEVVVKPFLENHGEATTWLTPFLRKGKTAVAKGLLDSLSQATPYASYKRVIETANLLLFTAANAYSHSELTPASFAKESAVRTCAVLGDRAKREEDASEAFLSYLEEAFSDEVLDRWTPLFDRDRLGAFREDLHTACRALLEREQALFAQIQPDAIQSIISKHLGLIASPYTQALTPFLDDPSSPEELRRAVASMKQFAPLIPTPSDSTYAPAIIAYNEAMAEPKLHTYLDILLTISAREGSLTDNERRLAADALNGLQQIRKELRNRSNH